MLSFFNPEILSAILPASLLHFLVRVSLSWIGLRGNNRKPYRQLPISDQPDQAGTAMTKIGQI